MRKLWFSVLVLLMLGAAIGCDSGGDDEDTGLTDTEVFVGAWRLATLLLNGDDFTPALITLAGITVNIDFEAAAFTINVVSDTTTTISGTYNVNETQETLTLTSSDFANPIVLDYVITTDNQIMLETEDAALFIGLTGFDPADLPFVIETIGLIIQRTG